MELKLNNITNQFHEQISKQNILIQSFKSEIDIFHSILDLVAR